MSILNALYPQGDFLNIRANAPTQADYNIRATEDLVRNLPGGGIRDLLAPAAAATLSLPYDAIQAATRTTEDDISKAMETAGMYGPKDIASEAYGLAFGRENPLSSAYGRFMGASAPLAERISSLDLLGNFGFGTPAAASEVSIGEPNDIQDFLGTSTPTEISIPEAPKIFSPTQNYNFLPSAYEDETLGEDVGSTKSKFGIENLLETALGFAVPGFSVLKRIAGGGQPYEQFTPGGTIRNGIYSINGVNVPVSSFGGDFYNPNTGLNRFDRAAERFKKTGSMLDLFGSSRTGKEFFEKRREIEAKKQKALEDAAKAKRQFKEDTGGGGGRDSDTTSGPSSGTGRGATSATSSSLGGLGFSDKRLKENIELIGKSPSNINIYKFNYKNNPTTFQGVMADEVSWASVKHPNGYMMVDYSKIDVEFKKI